MNIRSKGINFDRLDMILKEHFEGSFICECQIPTFRKDLERIFSSSDVTAIMKWCFFSSVMQSAVHSFAPEIWMRYQAALTYDIQVFGHGGSHRVYRCFLQGIDRKALADFGARFLKDWATDFDQCYRGDGPTIVLALIHDLDFRKLVGEVHFQSHLQAYDGY